ncbi:unnamed protein product [Meloidogyne enterolobii]|uniref:Uncharacterized protein n=1 Tax=Meloidogyne enterolobii TaxID=390850 RepID=A0ACB1AJ60_MELEN
MSESEKELALWETIRELAEGRAISLANASKIPEDHQQQHQRTKRFSTTVFSPIILSPFHFAPFFGLSVFGPVILSPSTFSRNLKIIFNLFFNNFKAYILSPSV